MKNFIFAQPTNENDLITLMLFVWKVIVAIFVMIIT